LRMCQPYRIPRINLYFCTFPCQKMCFCILEHHCNQPSLFISSSQGGSVAACITCQRRLSDWELGSYAQLGGRCLECCQKPQQGRDSCVNCGQVRLHMAMAVIVTCIVKCMAWARGWTHSCSWHPGQALPCHILCVCDRRVLHRDNDIHLPQVLQLMNTDHAADKPHRQARLGTP
jgi:hypothetical protein